MDNLTATRRKEFRTVGVVLFVVASGLLLARIIAQLISPYVSDTVADVVFTLIMQVGFLFVAPIIVYRFILGRSARGVLEFSNVRKASPAVLLICIPLGICCLIVTMGVSTIWYSFLRGFGYDSGGGATYPDTFNGGLFALELLLTGLLPGICEEFTNRGGLATVMRNSYGEAAAIAMCGLAFGLFHQNITQIAYTFIFGMVMALLVYRTGSVFPGMIVHFINNSLSVYLDYASEYSLPLGSFFDIVNNMLSNNFALAAFLWVLFAAVAAGLVIAIIKLSEKRPEAKTHSPTLLYRPVASDWAFYIGALVMTALSTVLTFVWGLM